MPQSTDAAQRLALLAALAQLPGDGDDAVQQVLSYMLDDTPGGDPRVRPGDVGPLLSMVRCQCTRVGLRSPRWQQTASCTSIPADNVL